jgi:hypothetical protein
MKEQEVLQHIMDIKGVIVDNHAKLPLAPRTILFSALMSLLLFGIIPKIFMYAEFTFSEKTFYSGFIMSAVMTTFYLYNRKIIQNENDKLDRPFSKNQAFVGQIYGILASVGIVMSLTVTIFGGYSVVFFYWLIFIGISLFVLGHFTLNMVKLYGLFLIVAGLILIVGYAFYSSSYSSGAGILPLDLSLDIYYFGQYTALLLAGIGQLILWFYIKLYRV